MAKLQLALDMITLDEAIALLNEVSDIVDIIEVGTPFMVQYGMQAVSEIRKHFPDSYILCDGKIMDAGAYEAEEMFLAGADCITVLAVTDLSTIKSCIETAEKYGKDCMIDMICVNDLAQKAAELEALGNPIIAVHTGVDQQACGRTPLGDLAILRAATQKARLAVAGGINLDTIPAYMEYKPDIVIVGGGIINASDRPAAAHAIAQKIAECI